MHHAGLDVVAAHLHHGQREEADEELLRCEGFCQELGLPFVSGKADVPAIAKTRKIGLEEAGRDARYAFFEKAAAQTGCDTIVTAHTKTDQAETILLNLIRGAGLSGLAGIPEQRGNVVRPLLGVSRAETRAYCREHGLWTHDDPANEDISFSRARIRLRVLPELEAVHPAAQDALCRLGALAGEEDRFLDAAAAAALERCELPLNGELRFLTLDSEVAFGRAALLHLPPVLLRRSLRLAVEALGGRLEFQGTHGLAQGLASKELGSVTAPGGDVAVEWDAETVHIRHLTPFEPYRHPLAVPGITESEVLGWAFEASFEESASGTFLRNALSVAMNRTKIKGNLHFRSAQAGDALAPMGFGKKRKLSDLMGEAKLTPAARSRLPIVCDMAGPIWAPGVCLDDRVAPHKDAFEREHAETRINPMPDGVENGSPGVLILTFRPIIQE